MTVSALTRTIEPAAFVWVLESLCREHGLPFEQAIVLRRHPPPHDCGTLKAAIEGLGIEATLVAVDARELHTGNEPWFVLWRPVSSSVGAASEHGDDEPLSVLRARAGDDVWVRVQDRSASPEIALSRDEFHKHYLGYAIRTYADSVAAEPVLDRGAEEPKFGLSWFVPEMWRYRAVWRDVLLASLFIQLLALLVPLLTQTIIDKVLTHRTMNTLLVVAAALVFATLFSAALSWLRQYSVVHAGTRIDAVLAADVFGHLLHLPARYFEQRPTGVLVARMHGVETIREFVTGAALTLILDAPFMLLFAAIMLYYSPTLTAVVIALLAATVVVSVFGTPPLRRRIDAQFLAGARHQAFVTERVAAIETVKSLQLEPVIERRFEDFYARYLAAGVRTRLWAGSMAVLAQGIEQLLALSVLGVGAWLVIQGEGLTVGALIAFQMFAARLSAPALRIVQLWQEFQQVHVSVRRLADIKDVPREPIRERMTGAVSSDAVLRCRDVGFRYGDRPWLFRSLSFELRPGGCVAVIGASGSGKSTFARLLQGFYLPTEGTLYLDAIDTRRLAANEMRACFGVVPQETRLFSGTILDNLREAAPAAEFSEVVEACEAAGVHEVIFALPDGYLTHLGENGVGLSGGQKQRVAIARAMLKGARILLLDEATSSLDPELADAFVETINELRGRVAVLYIGHRLPARLQCDAVVQLGAVPMAEAP